jgi:hypothetical protein
MIVTRKAPLKRCADVMELTYGGRATAAPHNHGVRARQTSTVHAFWMVLEGSPQALPLTVFLSDGATEALALFSGEEEARMFCHFCEKGASAKIRQTTTGEVISLLYCPWCAAKHVALDPFPEILGGRLLELLTLDREDFARRFAGLGSDPVARPLWNAPRAPLLAASSSTHSDESGLPRIPLRRSSQNSYSTQYGE